MSSSLIVLTGKYMLGKYTKGKIIHSVLTEQYYVAADNVNVVHLDLQK